MGFSLSLAYERRNIRLSTIEIEPRFLLAPTARQLKFKTVQVDVYATHLGIEPSQELNPEGKSRYRLIFNTHVNRNLQTIGDTPPTGAGQIVAHTITCSLYGAAVGFLAGALFPPFIPFAVGYAGATGAALGAVSGVVYALDDLGAEKEFILYAVNFFTFKQECDTATVPPLTLAQTLYDLHKKSVQLGGSAAVIFEESMSIMRTANHQRLGQILASYDNIVRTQGRPV